MFIRKTTSAIALAMLYASSAIADDAPSPASALPFKIESGVDAYVGFNPNQPTDGVNFVPGAGTTGKRANEFSINSVSIHLSNDPSPVGFNLVLNGGTSESVIHEGEPKSLTAGPQLWQLVHNASVSYRVPGDSHLTLEAGILPCHIGFETFFAKDNWNYTRAWIGELSPYYLTGVKAGWNFSEQWSAQVWVVNGWQLISDNNKAKSIGTQIAWNGSKASVFFNTLVGPEIAKDNDHWRFFGDLVAQYQPTENLKLAWTGDAAAQQRSDAPQAIWYATAIWSRYQLNNTFATAARAEYFNDHDGVISGTAQTLVEGTLTLEAKPADHLVLRLEGRFDHSTQNVFATNSPNNSKTQPLLILGAMTTF